MEDDFLNNGQGGGDAEERSLRPDDYHEFYPCCRRCYGDLQNIKIVFCHVHLHRVHIVQADEPFSSALITPCENPSFDFLSQHSLTTHSRLTTSRHKVLALPCHSAFVMKPMCKVICVCADLLAPRTLPLSLHRESASATCGRLAEGSHWHLRLSLDM